MKALVHLLAMALLAGCAGAPVVPEQPSAATFDIRAAVQELMGKTTATVVQALGRPDREHGGGHREWWTYENRFYDSVTRKTLPVVTVVVRDGKVVAITF
jgi:outer membrane protein assembly factor BamE (lipoprotein component of BamABCDE complex)